MTGSVNLTVPLAALLGLTGSPGEVAGFGPITASSARDLAAMAAANPAVRWCITVLGDYGQAVAHGCAIRPQRGSQRGPGQEGRPRGDPDGRSADGWSFTATLRALAAGDCSHERETRAYKLSAALRHLIEVRNPTCTFPGCRRPARRCDQDHTTPFHQGGRSCECNVAPLCRFHHKVKQADGWKLTQPVPGTLVWVAPSGWTYTVRPDAYPA